MAISSGVYSLIGVVVGSLGTGGFQLGLAVRVDRRDARLAKRQVQRELLRKRATLDLVADAPGYIIQYPQSMDAPMWVAHGDRLARDLSDADWMVVRDAYEAMSWLAVLGRNKLVDSIEEAVEGVRGSVDLAIARLA